MKITITYNENDVELINGVLEEVKTKQIDYDGLQAKNIKGNWGFITLRRGQITFDFERIFITDIADICKTFAKQIRMAYELLFPKVEAFMDKYDSSVVENVEEE